MGGLQEGIRFGTVKSASERIHAHRRAQLAAGLARQGIRDARVLDAVRQVPRHRFCAPADAGDAERDTVLALPAGATLSQPYVVARMLEALALRGGERVLDVGAGSGYTSALLAALGAEVHAVELEPELAARARDTLAALGTSRVTVHAGDGHAGLPEEAPFDAVLVSAATPDFPPRLLEQLAPGGRIVAPLGDAGHQELVVRRDTGGRWEDRALDGVRFVPLRPAADRSDG